MLTIIYCTAILNIVYASLFEWILHKYFMHKKTWGIEYPFSKHAGVHHRKFRADETYHLTNENDKRTIPMAWWNGPILVLISGIPFDVIGWYIGPCSDIPANNIKRNACY